MRKFVIDGIEFEVSESAAQAWEKASKAQAAELETAKAEGATQKTRADGLEAKVAELTAKAEGAEKARADAADPKKFEAAVQSRVALLTEARKVLGAEAKLDGLDDTGIRKAVIVKVDAEAKLEGATADFVAGAYAAALKAHAAKPAPAVTRVDGAGAAPTGPVDRKAELAKAIAGANKLA